MFQAHLTILEWRFEDSCMLDFIKFNCSWFERITFIFKISN